MFAYGINIKGKALTMDDKTIFYWTYTFISFLVSGVISCFHYWNLKIWNIILAWSSLTLYFPT